MTTLSCRACNTLGREVLDLSPSPIAAQDFSTSFQIGIRKSLSLMECPACGLIYINANPVEYYRSVKRNTTISAPLSDLRRNISLDLKSKLIDQGFENPSVFEVGAHEGENLQIFRGSGFRTYGSEFFNDSGELIKSFEHSTVWDVSFDDSPLHIEALKARFDSVISFNFLEHFREPRVGLENMYSIMKPGAVGYIEVPNFDAISSRSNFLEFIADHLQYFRSRSLQALILNTGFSILQIDSLWDDYIIGCYFKKPQSINWDSFRESRSRLAEDLAELGELARASEQKIFLWGAGHQSLFMLTHFNVAHLFAAVVDASPQKAGKFARNIPLPIVEPANLPTKENIIVLVCAGGFNEEIVSNLNDRQNIPQIFEVHHGRVRAARY